MIRTNIKRALIAAYVRGWITADQTMRLMRVMRVCLS